MGDRTDPNRHLPPHPRSPYCVDAVCDNDVSPSLFDDAPE